VPACNQTARGFRLPGMRTLAAVIGTGVLFALVVGCGGRPTGGSAAGSGGTPTLGVSSTPPTVGSSTLTPGPPPGPPIPADATVVPVSQVDATALPPAFPRLVWTEQGGTVVGFYGEIGGCFTSGAKLEGQTSTRVTIRLIQQEGPIRQACPLYRGFKPMNVTLTAPLGARTVVLQLSIVRS
jgi:hypothetical protein